MKNSNFIIALSIFLITIACVVFISRRGVPVVTATNLEKLPMEIAGYKATEDFFSDAVYKELNADKNVYRHYVSEKGIQIDLYIGYYGTAKGGRTPHNPYGCLPGGGWGIVETNQIEVKPDYAPDGVMINYILSQKDSLFYPVLHWYQTDHNRILASGFQQNLQRFIGRIFKNKNDGAFLRVSMVVEEKELIQANQYLKKFATAVLNFLPQFWPDEK